MIPSAGSMGTGEPLKLLASHSGHIGELQVQSPAPLQKSAEQSASGFALTHAYIHTGTYTNECTHTHTYTKDDMP